MNRYYQASKRKTVSYDHESYAMTETDEAQTRMNRMTSFPEFRSLHQSTEPSKIGKLKSKSMDKDYTQFINDVIVAFNHYIDELLENGTKQSKTSPFVHRRIKTKTMNDTMSCSIIKIYEIWFSIFNHHSINRLSIHSVSPKRDFIHSLNALQSMLKCGYFPTELIMREIALIPAHCSMYRELVLLDRFMIRLAMIPSLEYLQTIITSNARRSHVEYRKFEQYYRENELPLPVRSQFAFFDQDPTDSYPFTDAVDCAPESFFDYFLTDLPQKLLLSGKCTNCKHRLSGEEILAGFQNLKRANNKSTFNNSKNIKNIQQQQNGKRHSVPSIAR